jgi:ribokinase
MSATRVTVVGSVNLDLVASGATLPVPGQTVTGATFSKHPGGKGANQALAARRLGAQVHLIARVGQDAAADDALALLVAEGIDMSCVQRDAGAPTGVALIAVAANGENQIVVAPGANAELAANQVRLPPHDAVICQLEVPEAAIAAAATQCRGLLVLNLAPAKPMPPELLQRAGLIVVNETEAEYYGAALDSLPGMVALTLGRRGAQLRQAGRILAGVPAPTVTPLDTTGAGDAFVAALTVALVEGQPSERALSFACAAGAAATLVRGAQPSLPTRAQIDALRETPS